MCFSATSSFVAAGGLVSLGLLTVSQARQNRLQLAAIPIGFGLQQAAEGIVWLTIGNIEYLHIYTVAIYTFLFFGLAFWPFWTAMALRQAETDPIRKKFLFVLDLMGTAVGFISAHALATQPVSAAIEGYHITYYIGSYDWNWSMAYLAAYCLVAVGPFFVSSLRYAWLLGVTLMIALAVTYWAMQVAVISVWCFFAAILSVQLYLIVRSNGKKVTS